MRGPGAVPGLFAMESAMDELALALKMDPVQLRLRNEPDMDETQDIPFSSRHFKECLTRGARRIRLEQARSRDRLHAPGRHGARLGHGRLHLDRRPLSRPKWHLQLNADGSRARLQRHPGHRHRHLHGDRADGGGAGRRRHRPG